MFFRKRQHAPRNKLFQLINDPAHSDMVRVIWRKIASPPHINRSFVFVHKSLPPLSGMSIRSSVFPASPESPRRAKTNTMIDSLTHNLQTTPRDHTMERATCVSRRWLQHTPTWRRLFYSPRLWGEGRVPSPSFPSPLPLRSRPALRQRGMGSTMGVNAAGVATPNIWPAGVVLCWRPPQYFDNFFIFSLQRNSWIPQVAVIFICTISHHFEMKNS